MAELRQLFVKLGIKFDKKSAQDAQKGVDRLIQGAKQLVAVFAVGKIVQSIDGLVKSTAALGDSIDKTSQRLGISAQALQELRFAGELGGVAIGEMDGALQSLTQNAATAARGGGAAREAFALLGVSVRDAGGRVKSSDRLFTDITNSLGKVGDASEQARLAQQLFGGAGAALLPVLRQGGAALAKQRAEARALGLMDRRLIKLSARFTDEQTRLGKAFQGIRNIIAKELLPGFIDADNAITEFIIKNREVIKLRIQQFIRGVSSFLAQMGRAFLTAGKSIATVVDLLGPMGKTILKITGFALALTPVLFFLFTSPLAPILLIIGAIVLIISELQALGEGGKTLIGPLLEPFLLLVDKVGFAKAALQVLGKAWDALKAAAEPVLDFLSETFSNIFQAFLDDTKGIRESWSELFADIGGFISSISERIGAVTSAIAGLFGGGDEMAISAMARPEGGEMVIPPLMARLENGEVPIPPAIARPVPGGGGTTLTNAPRTNVDITVNAPGAADPGAIADEIDKRMRTMDERNLRNAQQALVPAGA